MDYYQLMYIHLYTVIPCFFLGGLLFVIKQGTKFHKNLGKVYMVLMLVTAIVTLFMPAHVGPRLFNHLGWIHSFSFLTIYTVPSAYLSIKNGRVRAHKIKMLSLYVGAIIIAGSFTFFPGRFMHKFFFG